MDFMTDALRLLLFPSLMAFAASSDLLTMTISNRISLLLIAGFVALAPAAGLSFEAMGWHFLAGLLVLVVSFGFFSRGWVGGGDAKLAAAAALWFGFDQMMPFLLYASVLGGALTLLMLQFREYPLHPVFVRQDWVLRLHHKDTGIPYGIALAASALMTYPDTVWMKGF